MQKLLLMVHQFGVLGEEPGRLPVMNVFGPCCTRHLMPATYRPLCPTEALSRMAAWWQQSIGENQPSLQLGGELCEVKFGEGACFCTDGAGTQGGPLYAVRNRPYSSHILFNTTLKQCHLDILSRFDFQGVQMHFAHCCSTKTSTDQQ